jgi:hypothetical protein
MMRATRGQGGANRAQRRSSRGWAFTLALLLAIGYAGRTYAQAPAESDQLSAPRPGATGCVRLGGPVGAGPVPSVTAALNPAGESPGAPPARADELSALKATVLQLQERLNQLAPPADSRANSLLSAPTAFHPAEPGARPAPPLGPEVQPQAVGAPPSRENEMASPASGPARVEPGRHPLEFLGSGIFGPHNYDETNRWLDFGIIVQAEYLQNSPTGGPNTEQLFFRRLRPTIMGGIGDWQGIIMMDFGAGEDGTTYSPSIRWANFQYTGFYQAHATFGSFKPWFSRELLTMGPHLAFIERTPVGDTNYGNPDFMIGFAWDQMLPNRKAAYYLSVGLEDHVQGVTQMQMRSPAYAASNANQGVLFTGRADYYLIGEMPYDSRPLHETPPIMYNQGDFHTKAWRAMVSTAAYGWINDGNSNPFTLNGVSTSTTQADLDRAFGVEVSGGVRGYGLSADVEYQYGHGDLLARDFTGGLYVNGQTNMNKFAAIGGYMLPRNVELVGAWSVVGASGFERALTETKVGVNWYVMKYGLRFAATYSFINNNNGIPGNNLNVARALAQFVW